MDNSKISKALKGDNKDSRLSPTMEEALNKQILIELDAAQLYLAMSYWCDWKGYKGAAKFLKEHAVEEIEHRDKVVKYMLDRGALPKVLGIKTQPSEFSDLKTVLMKGLEHETMVTNSYKEVCMLAAKEYDLVTKEFLSWFIEEQIDEEGVFMDLLDRLSIIGNDKRAEYFLDKELSKIKE